MEKTFEIVSDFKILKTNKEILQHRNTLASNWAPTKKLVQSLDDTLKHEIFAAFYFRGIFLAIFNFRGILSSRFSQITIFRGILISRSNYHIHSFFHSSTGQSSQNEAKEQKKDILVIID